MSVLHVGKVRATNYRKLTILDVNLSGNHIKVTGPNACGKSSFVSTLFSLLTGNKAKDPIHHGAEQATLHGDVIDQVGNVIWKIARMITPEGEKLELSRGDGSRVKLRPQGHLDAISLPLTFSPSDWLRRRPQDRLADVLRVGKIKPPIEAVERIVGEPIECGDMETASDYLDRLVGEKTGIFFDRRTSANRVKQQKEKALAECRPPDDDGEIEVDVTALIDERATLDSKREVKRQAQLKVDQARVVCEEKQRKLQECRNQLARAQENIADLERKLAIERDIAKKAEALVKLGEVKVPELRAALDAQTKAANAIADPSPRIAEIDREVAQANTNRQQIAARQQARESRQRLVVEADAADADHKRLDKIVTELRDLQKTLLNDTALGIEGLSVRNGELYLEDCPFDEGSEARKVECAIDLACMENPDLKILMLDGAERFDAKTEKRILARAEKRGFQVALAAVDPTGEDLSYTVIEAHYAKS
jgi:hypothetical protein